MTDQPTPTTSNASPEGDLATYGPPAPEALVHVRTRDAAEILGISERTVRKHIAAGKLPAQRINGAYMVEMPREQVEAAGITLEPLDPDDVTEDERPRALVVQRPEERRGAAVDLAPLADTISDLSRQLAEQAAATAMWQERARQAEARALAAEARAAKATDELRALPATVPPRPWWKFWE